VDKGRLAEVRPAKVRPTEVRYGEVRSAEARFAEVRLAKVGLAEVRLFQLNLYKGRTLKVCPAQVRFPEIRPAEVRSAEACFAQVRPAEVRPCEICPAEVGADVGVLDTPSVPVSYRFLKPSDVFVVRHASSSTRLDNRALPSCACGSGLASMQQLLTQRPGPLSDVQQPECPRHRGRVAASRVRGSIRWPRAATRSRADRQV
jgi:hypothetical protein